MTSSITNIVKPLTPGEMPQMSYTGVTTNRDMAQAFMTVLLRTAASIVPEKDWSVDDLISVLNTATAGQGRTATLIEGRYLRRSLRDHMNRADRYHEVFTVMVLGLDADGKEALIQTVVDALFERLRKSDMVFLYKRRVVILLPHATRESARILFDRLTSLINKVVGADVALKIESRTYPSDDIDSQDDLLDWVEERLR